MILPGEQQGHNQKVERTHHQVNAWAEQKVDFAHIIGSARHGVAYRLDVVKSHALAQQANVNLIAGFAFHCLRQQLNAKVAGKLDHTAG